MHLFTWHFVCYIILYYRLFVVHLTYFLQWFKVWHLGNIHKCCKNFYSGILNHIYSCKILYQTFRSKLWRIELHWWATNGLTARNNNCSNPDGAWKPQLFEDNYYLLVKLCCTWKQHVISLILSDICVCVCVWASVY